jgi:hypothetical protein
VKEELNSMLEFWLRLSRHWLFVVLSLALGVACYARAGVEAQEQAPSGPVGASPQQAEGQADQTTGALKPKDTAYVWSASRSEGSLRLRGSVPSEEDRRTVLGMVKAHFPDLEVEDRLKIASGVPNKEQWLGAVSFGLKQLARLKEGSARLLGVGLKIDGEARSPADYAEVKKALAGPLPTGLTVMNDNVRPPMVDPFIFTADFGPSGLTLSGSVPSEEARGRLRELSRKLFLRPTLDDQLQPASGAPKNWDDAVAAALRALSRLESGKVALSGLAVTIEGVAPDKGTAVAVSYQLKRDLPALFSSSESIRWKEADTSHDLGERLIARLKQEADALRLVPGPQDD